MASAGISNYTYSKSSYSSPSDIMSMYRRTTTPRSYISPAERTSLSSSRNYGGTSYATPRPRDSSTRKSSPKPFISTYASSYNASSYNTYPSSSSSPSTRTLPVLDSTRRMTYAGPSYGASRSYTDRSQNGASGGRYGSETTDAADSNFSSRSSRFDTQSRSRPLRAVEDFKTSQENYRPSYERERYNSETLDRRPSGSGSEFPTTFSGLTIRDRVASLKRSNSTFDLAAAAPQRDISKSGEYSAKGGNERYYSSTSSNHAGENQSSDSTDVNNENNHNGKSSDWSDGRQTENGRAPSSDRQTAPDPRLKRFSSVDRFGAASRHSISLGSEKICAGLRNLGNTCFMNSVLQCLAHTQPLLDFCLNNDYEPQINHVTSRMSGHLVSAFLKLIQTMWRSSDAVSAVDFKQEIERFAKRFVGYNQQDAQEFLIYLLEGLHEDLNRIRDKTLKRYIDNGNEVERISASDKARESWTRYQDFDNSAIVDIFVGQLRSELTCLQCGYISNTFDPFFDLSLPLRKGRSVSDNTLLDCFELFSQEETMDGDEKPTCAQCKKRQPCTKRLSIQRFPNVLIVHLKRFSQDYSSYRSKISSEVKCPLRNLDLSKFSAERNIGAVKYDLFAVSNHSGTSSGGHYTASALDQYSREWHCFNDHRVSRISESSVISSEAYILFYKLSSSS